jgi:hypothetical protein
MHDFKDACSAEDGRLSRSAGPRRKGTSIKAGSEPHKELFCRHFIETYQEYDPETLPWPDLDDAALTRLRGVPFWQEVYHTERRAGAIVTASRPRLPIR